MDEATRRRASGDVPGAQQVLEEALRLRPDDPKALVAFGRLQLLDLSDPDAALRTYRRAVQVAPQNARTRTTASGSNFTSNCGMPAACGLSSRRCCCGPAGLTRRRGWARRSWRACRRTSRQPSSTFSRRRGGCRSSLRVRARPIGPCLTDGPDGGRTAESASLQAARGAEALDHPEAQYALGQSLLHLGRQDAARAALQRFPACSTRPAASAGLATCAGTRARWMRARTDGGAVLNTERRGGAGSHGGPGPGETRREEGRSGAPEWSSLLLW